MSELNSRDTARRAAVISLAALAVFSAFALVVRLAEVWLLIFAGLLLAVLLSAAADTVARLLGRSRGVSLALVMLTGALTVAGAAYAFWPAVSEQGDELITRLPSAWGELRGTLNGRPWGSWLLEHVEPEQVVTRSAVVSQATTAVSSSAGALGGLLVVLFVGIYVAAEPSLYRHGVRRLLPQVAQPRFETAANEVGEVLRWWLVGKLLSMVLVGVTTTLGLWLLGVPLALVFGLMAAVLTFIPNFGPVLSVVPPALLALTEQPRTAAYVVALYVGIQAVESYAITPLIQRRTVSLPPALTITAQVALGLLVGALGVAVATPLTAAAMTAIRVLYVEPKEAAGG